MTLLAEDFLRRSLSPGQGSDELRDSIRRALLVLESERKYEWEKRYGELIEVVSRRTDSRAKLEKEEL